MKYYYEKCKIKRYKNYNEYLIDHIDTEPMYILSIPIYGWICSIIMFSFYPIGYLLDYKVVYKKIKLKEAEE